MLELKEQINVRQKGGLEDAGPKPKTCPSCDRVNDYEARICICGHWFVERAIFQQEYELLDVRRGKARRTRSKVFILASFVVLLLAMAAILGGFLDFGGRADEQQETASSEAPSQDSLVSPNTSRAAKNTLTGRAISVDDAGIVTIQTGNNQALRVKLAGIDAPKINEDFGQQYKDNLASLLLNQDVLVIQQKIEDDGLIIGKITVRDRNINLELVQSGFARYDRSSEEYQSDDDIRLFAEAETNARAAQLGLWSTASPAPPEGEVVNNPQFLKSSGQQPASRPSVDSSTGVQTVNQNTDSEPIPADSDRVTSEQPATPTNSAESTATKPVTSAQPNPAAVNPDKPVKTGPDGNQYFLGPRGGCYRISSSGSKRYVDKSMCTPR